MKLVMQVKVRLRFNVQDSFKILIRNLIRVYVTMKCSLATLNGTKKLYHVKKKVESNTSLFIAPLRTFHFCKPFESVS